MNKTYNRLQKFSICSCLIFVSTPAFAQITPDNTLGAESSRLTPNVPIGGENGDRIDGGATRGSNLFHSFSQFNIDDGQRVYFGNPAGIENILTRVTGGQASNILGTLGVDGGANLFLINPNGIIFGQNAQLDVRGSFVGTTANAIGFGELGFFSATDPSAPPLLTINPTALLFTQLNGGSIVSQSIAPAGTSPAGLDLFGLRVPDGESLLLVGGDVQIDGGDTPAGLTAQGGRIELGGLVQPGAIRLDSNFQLTYPSDVALSNVSLLNNARVRVRGIGGGDVVVNANDFSTTNGGRLTAGTEGTGDAGNITVNANTVNFAGVASDGAGSGLNNVVLENGTGTGGNITVNTNSFHASSGARIDSGTFGSGNSGDVIINTNSLNAASGTVIDSSTLGSGNAGDVIINAGDTVALDDATIFSNVGEDAKGLGGDISITTGSLFLTNGAQLIGGTFGDGNSGNVIINARDTVALDNAATIFNDVEKDAVGFGGDISITTGTLSLKNDAQLITGTSGAGNSGNVIIDASDTVTLDEGALIFNDVEKDAVGFGGDISITTGSLFLTNGAQLIGGTSGSGNSGNVIINARDTVALDGGAAIFNDVEKDAVGFSGDISITTGTLSLTNGAQLLTNTLGAGDSGDVSINARDINFQGSFSDSDGRIFRSGIGARVEEGATGRAGDVTITAGTLSISDGAGITASTRGEGDAGNVFIQASEYVSLKDSLISSSIEQNGVGQGGTIQIRTELLSLADESYISSSTDGQGDAGSILIEAGSLSMTRSDPALSLSGYVTTNTTRQGNAGSVTINVRDALSIDQGAISTNVSDSGLDDAGFAGKGQGGDIRITTGSLALTNEALINAASTGQGNAGNIFVDARDTVSLDNSGITASVGSFNGSTAVGRAGDIQINARSLLITNGGDLASATYGQGNAGKIEIRATDSVVIDNGSNNLFTGITSAVLTDGVGKGGDIQITTGSLSLANSATLLAGTDGQGDSGNVIINARERVSFSSGATLYTTTSGQGNAGSVTIQTSELSVDGVNQDGDSRSGIFSTVAQRGIGRAGNIDIVADSLAITNGGLISAATTGRGKAGEITIKAGERVSLSGTSPNGQFRSAIATETTNTSTEDAGNLTIATQRLSISDGAIISSATLGRGRAGDITINASDSISLSGLSPNGQYRSAITTETTDSATGNAGNLNIATELFNIRDRAGIFAASFGQGRAGDITVQADSLSLNRGQISTQTASTNGGNLTLNLDDTLILRNNSIISTNAGTASAGGDGGNITINTPFIIALPNENSDISANAYSGRGGNVSINAQSIFGIQARPLDTSQSDITASSELGVSGQIDITQPDVQPEQGLVELPASILDASDQIAQACPNGATAARPLGKFVVTGRGSLPPNPLELLAGTTSLSPLAALDGETQANQPPQTTSKPVITATPNPIVEAQGWVRTAGGKIALVAHAPQATPSAPPTVAACPNSNQK